MPRGVNEAIEQLPDAQKSSLAQKYNEMADLAKSLQGDQVPDSQRLEVLARAVQLRDELKLALENASLTGGPLSAELARLDSVVGRLQAKTTSEVEIGRDMEGRRTRTEYIRMKANDAVVGGFHGIGRLMGAIMVVHSVEELAGVGRDAELGKVNIPQGALEIAHAAFGVSIGVRMARTTYRQALAGAGAKVAPGNSPSWP